MFYFMICTVAIGFITTKGGPTEVYRRCKQYKVSMVSKQTSTLKLKFYCLLELLIKTVTSDKVSPADILAVLPREISSRLQLEGATTINAIFRENAALDEELKWYSFPLLSLLISNYGDDKCKEELSNYDEFLRDYLQSRARNCSSIKTHPTPHGDDISHPTTPLKPPHIKLIVDPEWDQELVESESDAPDRDYIASLLNTTKNHIKFIQAIYCIA